MATLRSTTSKPKERTAAKRSPVSKAAKKPAAARKAQASAARTPRSAASATQAKHRRAAEMLRELRSGAEALSANADRLLSRFAS